MTLATSLRSPHGNTVTNPGAINLAGLTFEVITGSYAIVGGDLTAPGGTLSITNLDTGNDRRFAAGALIGARLTGAMHVVFAGAAEHRDRRSDAPRLLANGRLEAGAARGGRRLVGQCPFAGHGDSDF